MIGVEGSVAIATVNRPNPLPMALVAATVTVLEPATVGVPRIIPVTLSMVRPLYVCVAAPLTTKLKLVGLFVAVTGKPAIGVPSTPTTSNGLLVIAGAPGLVEIATTRF